MRLATIEVQNPTNHSEKIDGRLILVSDCRKKFCYASDKFKTLLSAIESWGSASEELKIKQTLLNSNSSELETFNIESAKFKAPLPRTYAWLDGSAFIQHVILVRKARGAEPPEDLLTVPLMYQGISDTLIGPFDPIILKDELWGMDFEGEVAVVVDDVPMGVSEDKAKNHIKLIMLMNDVSLRNLIPKELATGFGFFHGKPSSSFAPFAVTPDELGAAWNDCKVHLPLESWLNEEPFGHPNASEMHFSFAKLISHAAKTRALTAGTIIGSGTVSNKDESVGSSCLAEKRMLEIINTGTASTPFMKKGDKIKFDMKLNGKSIFGQINQIVA
jgi:fumarylacetoacetate (FAA) hydrolase